MYTAPATVQVSHQIAAVVDTLYMVVSVPSESLAFLHSQHANTGTVQRLMLAANTSTAAQLTVGAILCHLSQTELKLESSGCSVPGFYVQLLTAHIFDDLLTALSKVGLDCSNTALTKWLLSGQ